MPLGNLLELYKFNSSTISYAIVPAIGNLHLELKFFFPSKWMQDQVWNNAPSETIRPVFPDILIPHLLTRCLTKKIKNIIRLQQSTKFTDTTPDCSSIHFINLRYFHYLLNKRCAQTQFRFDCSQRINI